jgi:hypothetical protein
LTENLLSPKINEACGTAIYVSAMNFYYDKLPEIPAGIVQKTDVEFLCYVPHLSFAYLKLSEDLEQGKECVCRLEDGRKIIVTGRAENIRN